MIEELPEGPLDIVGDVHGELGALERLLHKLGYDLETGRHDDGRNLVFVGDLVDRGPDSPGVLKLVKRMNARCIVGNHELNALRNDPEKYRPGEDWWYQRSGRFPSRIVTQDEKEELLPFLESRPIALEREDLRIVHACWHPSIEALRGERSVIGGFHARERALAPELEDLKRRAEAAFRAAGYSKSDLHRRSPRVELVPEYALLDERKQMGNPIKVATSGVERVASESFYASDKWRMVGRLPWWQEYDDVPVVVGHYWRRYYPNREADPQKRLSDLFGDLPPSAWLGEPHRVMCIDYSVGYRHKERRAEKAPDDYDTCLAALRVPEWQLVFDDGRASLDVGPPGRD